MGVLTRLRDRLRRRPVDPQQALARAQADARRRAVREQGLGHGLGSSYGGAGDGL